MDEHRISTSQRGRSGLLATLLTLVLLGVVPETLASGELRAEAQGRTHGVAPSASAVPGDDGRLLCASGLAPGNGVAKEIRIAEMLIARGARPPVHSLQDPSFNLKTMLRG